MRKDRENRIELCDRGATGFGFASHWLKNWHEIFKPITELQSAIPIAVTSEVQYNTIQYSTIQYNTITLFKEGSTMTYYSFLTYGPQ